jgi:hypothetical protein
MHIMARGAHMTAIGPEAQALIDRLHAVDLARPKLESEAVENAFNRHLEALGLPLRPIRAMPDASSAYRRMIDLADATSRLDATRAARSTSGSIANWPLATPHMVSLSISRGASVRMMPYCKRRVRPPRRRWVDCAVRTASVT